ncbi:TIP41-like family-domain-containing protein [Gilbertella persicaria]|uniref:TIP41-like family-domain-containing protein n=1 Tax=Gilbertella persicaria TaxID=101096 RepID=UPI00221F8250|nr:TIP41-like family-domain-containing protein [Gilbertella persicaria]KAI8047050.1 TIP41-like family-domain-containing protein [Gilbertella persicaria]
MSQPVFIKEGTPKTGLTEGISLNNWHITSKKASICSSNEMEKIQKDFGLPPPEMVFGNNRVTVQHDDLKIEFNAYDALALVDTSSTSSEKIKVAYSDEWTRKSSANHTDIKDVVKPYDWTYSTSYRGTTMTVFETHEEESMVDIEHLKKQEPILFYDENILYEDELADNGTAILTVRLRVMPSCFLVLQRFFLRVDDVLFRINDTRLYHEYGKPYFVREYTSKEVHYSKIRQKLGRGDISLLNDQNWVTSVMPQEPTITIKEKLKV